MGEELHPIEKILILGNGSWGSTICGMLQDPERYPPEKDFEDPNYNIRIYGPKVRGRDAILGPDGTAIWSDPAFRDAEDADLTIFAVKSEFMRETAHKFGPYLDPNCYVINVAKGIVYDEQKKDIYLMHEVLQQELKRETGHGIATLAGPNIAKDVRRKPYRGIMTAIACLYPEKPTPEDQRRIKQIHDLLRKVFTLDRFGVLQKDHGIFGLELSTSIKNVIAFASGAVHGYYEEQARHDCDPDPNIMSTIGSLLEASAQEAEFMYHSIRKAKGLPPGRVPYIALGDLITTALSKNSRNFRAGYKRGVAQFLKEKKSIEEICQDVGEAVESITTVNSLTKYFEEKGWKDDFIMFENIRGVMYDEIHIEKALDAIEKGHPKIARLLEVMEKRARRNHERKTRVIKKQKKPDSEQN